MSALLLKIVLSFVAILMLQQANFLEATNVSGQGEITPNLRLVATVDGKSFYSDATEVHDWSGASEFCRARGMRLASITSAAQFAALNASSSTFENNLIHWTAGVDALEPRQFTWNTTGEALSAEYVDYRKNMSMPAQTCIAYEPVLNGPSYLCSYLCYIGAYTLCEM